MCVCKTDIADIALWSGGTGYPRPAIDLARIWRPEPVTHKREIPATCLGKPTEVGRRHFKHLPDDLNNLLIPFLAAQNGLGL